MIRNKVLIVITFIILVCILPIKALAIETEIVKDNENVNEEETINNNEEEITNQNYEEETKLDIDEQKIIEENNNELYYAVSKSENANLNSLHLDVEGLVPKFSRLVTEYNITVDKSITDINIVPTAEDNEAKVTVSGNRDLKEGDNVIYIVVTAEAGNTKTYTINVKKIDSLERINTKLKNLSINGYEIFPKFKSNIYSYNLVLNKVVENLEIITETENENASYEITGNTNLKQGDNLIKITVTAEDGETIGIYKINVYMNSKTVQVRTQNYKKAYMLLGILAIAIISITAIIIKKNKI